MGFRKLFKSAEFWVMILFLIVLSVRLIIVFQNPHFNYEAYFSLRQAEHITETGAPLYNDRFSYGEKTQLFAPLPHYVLAAFGLFLPLGFVAKILPNIFASLLVILAYFMSLKITKSPKISLLTAFMSGFIPIMFLEINDIAIDYLVVLLIFAIIYCIFKINERKYIDYALILVFLLVMTSPLAFILIIGLLFYLLLLKLENLKVEMKEAEMILFFTFLVFWVNLLIYKNAFLKHGLLIIWQNMPIQILANTFSQITLLESIYAISIIPLILGIYASYITFNEEKNKEVLLLIGFGISSFLLLWFKLLNLVTGLVFLSVTLVITASFALKKISEFVEKTKFHRYEKLLTLILIIVFIVTAVAPSFITGIEKTKEGPKTQELVVLDWASQNLPEDATIIAPYEEGQAVAYYAKRKNVIDSNFLLTPNIDQRLRDVDTVFNTQFETEAVTALTKYNAKYIYFSTFSMEKYGIEELPYMKNQDCFSEIYHFNQTKLFYSKCRIIS